MTRRILSLSICIFLLFTLGARQGASAEDEIRSILQLQDYLTAQRAVSAEEIDFTCSAEFYGELQEESFRLLRILCVENGIEDPNIGYLDSAHAIRLSSVTFTDTPWAACSTDEEVRSAILSFTADRAERFTLICSPELCTQLRENSHLTAYAAQGGILDYMFPLFHLETGIIQVKDIEYSERPYAVVEDYAQFSKAVAEFEHQGLKEFTIVFSPELFEKICQSSEERKIMEAGSTLSGYSAMGYGDRCAFSYSNVEYTDVPRMICRSEEDVTETICRMGAAGVTEFDLIFLDRSLYDSLAAEDFARLTELQTQAGMKRCEMSYIPGDMVHYANTVIISDAVALESTEQAAAYVREQIEEGSEEITLFCTRELYESLMGDLTERFTFIHSGMNRIYDLLSQAGICDYSLSSSNAAGVISIQIERLFPGTAIILAQQTGDGRALTAREQETWQAAAEVAQAAAACGSPLETARFIHDWLCEKNVYIVDEESDEDDTAIGAVLNGRANCDGYSDAFYLIGTLAGLNVRYQHGDSYQKGMFDFGLPITHIWNLLELDGQWRMVDVTWDDEEEGWRYLWFNVGQDIAERLHYWNEDMTVPLAPDTVRYYFSPGEYAVSTKEELDAALTDAAQNMYGNLYILYLDPELAERHNETLGAVSLLSRSSFQYSWEAHMQLLSVYGLHW